MNSPLVTVGLPVFNAERHLEETLASLLNQNYPNLEILISDNASTDRTAEICKTFCGKDSRIRYFRNEKNVGMTKNFNRLAESAKGDYFMWAGAHDRWEPDYVGALVRRLNENPSVVLAIGKLLEIDESGRILKALPSAVDTRGFKLTDRLSKVITGFVFFAIYGLIRMNALRKTNLFKPGYGTDSTLMAELSLQGEFSVVPSTTSYIRAFHNRKMTTEENILRLIGEAEKRSLSGKMHIRFPNLLWTMEMFRVIRKAKISPADKVKLCRLHLSVVKKPLLKELTIHWMPEGLRIRIKQGLKAINL